MLATFILPFTRGETWIAVGCILFIADGILLGRTGHGLPYWIGYALIALDALQLAVLRTFIPTLKLIRAAFKAEFSSTKPRQ